MNTLVIVGVFTALVIAFLSYWSKSHWSLKAVALPLFLILGLLSFEYYVDNLGAPIQTRPSGEHQYIYHIVTVKPSIMIWTWQPERGSRLYEYPYERNEAKELQEQKEKKEGGEEGGILKFDTDNDGIPIIEDLQEFSIPTRRIPKTADETGLSIDTD